MMGYRHNAGTDCFIALILITVASLNWHVADDWESRIEVQDVHGCADEADKELKTLLSQ